MADSFDKSQNETNAPASESDSRANQDQTSGFSPAERATGSTPNAGHDPTRTDLGDSRDSTFESSDGAGDSQEFELAESLPTREAGELFADRYRLMDQIGEGGMGSVWIARQTAPVKRSVAIKLIREGLDSKSILRRFEVERQALAMMDHPNIAQVLDAGETKEGQPFFVMELVKGVSITQFCDEAKLTVRQRLELFVLVCQAIQHAHHKGIIHRDIKPSNVLVTTVDDNPVPKVIDFGVAKAAGQPLTGESMNTGLGYVVGTPEYMSPEQAGSKRSGHRHAL